MTNINPLAKEYNGSKLLRFSFPNMVMMLFLSLYTIVDAIFVSNFVGTTALSCVNIVYPIINIELGIGIMLACGGAAIIAKKLGERKVHEACNNMTFIIVLELCFSFFFLIFGNLFIEEIVKVLGATDSMVQMSIDYLSTLLYFAPFYFLQTAFQTFFVTAGKPGVGLMATISGGVANIFLDYLFMGPFKMGIRGAALATGLSYMIPATIGIIFFAFFRKKELVFVRPHYDGHVFFESCFNGSSEMVTNLANAVTTYLYNLVFLKYYGEAGVASITIVLYFQFVLNAILFGYASGIAPIISYKYGENKPAELKKIHRFSLWFISLVSIGSYFISLLSIDAVLNIFTSDKEVIAISKEGFHLYALGFLMMGISIYASSLFTSLSNGKVSAIISFARTFLFLSLGIILIPMLLGRIGIWLAVPIAEFLGLLVSLYSLLTIKNNYF